ncbi:leucine rich adaptor protein 1-like [Aplochiton taeniatus]
MEEESRSDSIPGLKEMEIKIGRKTPESLLIWMRDAAHREEWCSERERLKGKVNWPINDGLSEKIRDLKLDMAWLRSADVGILRQLVAVHEGIEALRWLLEERGGLASRGSSLASSQCSLVAADGPAGFVSMSPCRESPSPTGLTGLQDPEDAGGEPERAQGNVASHIGYFEGPTSSDSPEERPSYPGGSTSTPGCSAVVGEGSMTREENSKTSEALLGYDAQWHWVESQDDVTFL